MSTFKFKMKILSAAQIRALDQYTIEQEPIPSIDLMERASLTFVDWFVHKFSDDTVPVSIFCGPGNNGGDGLAVARLLYRRFYTVKVFFCKIGNNTSADFNINFERLPARSGMEIITIEKQDPLPELGADHILIDAIFGTGINRPVSGYWGQLLDHINALDHTVVAIDMPSGLVADAPTKGTCIQADHTFSFEMPKLAFMFPENHLWVGQWQFGSIGLNRDFIDRPDCSNVYVDKDLIKPLLKKQARYDHKGTYGHALLIAGSRGKVGAAILAAKACLRSGAGLVTLHSPDCAYEILQISVPEAMISLDTNTHYFSSPPPIDKYAAIGIGCGLDIQEDSQQALKRLLDIGREAMVIDADGLNILGLHQEWLAAVPEGSILTPHPKEFERLFGPTDNNFERNELQRKKAVELGIYIILKGAHTCIAAPDGTCYFNSTGNPGLATAGSGDVLTGILTALLAQGYSSLETCLLGVYLHGLAGDIGVQDIAPQSFIASDIVQYLGKAFNSIK